MKIGVFGSKDFNSYKLLCHIINKIIKETKISNISFYTTDEDFFDKESGINYGISHFLEMYCDLYQFPMKRYPIEWDNVLTSPNPIVKERNGKKYNARAPFERNEKIIIECDIILLLHKNESEFKNIAELCKKHNKILFNFDLSNH